MDAAAQWAFFDELEKIAYGFQDVGKVLRLAKQRMVRLPKALEAGGPGAVTPGTVKRLTAQARGSSGWERRQVLEDLEKAKEMEGKILIPKGGATKWLQKRMGFGTKLSRKGRKATESVIQGHELDELALGARGKAIPSRFTRRFAHADPDVVLRERNRLLTLPQNVRGEVGKFMQELRELQPGKTEVGLLEKATRGVSGQGLGYVSGPRLSRHARRRVSERMKELT